MGSLSDEHTARIEQFRSDLKVLQPSDVIRKHITTGTPVFLTAELYFTLRSLIANHFKLYPGEVVLVGSSRTGFSIVPTKRYREATPSADLDVALISAERFDEYWDGVFAYSAIDRAWKRSTEYKRFVRMLFDGWIDPRGLPNVPRFEPAAQWSDFFDGLIRSRRFGLRRISARLYRTWSRLEAYQEIAVRKCISNLGGHHA
jgi:hypothetical protein